MNNSGQGSILVVLMLGVVLIIIALELAHPLNQVTTDARIDLNCSNSTLAYQDKANCVVVDSFNYLQLGLLLGLAGLIIWRAFV